VGTLVVLGSLGLARFSYSLVLPGMQRALGLGNTGAGAVATANLTGYLVVAVTGGFLASRYSTRLVIWLGMAVVGAGMLATGAAGVLGAVLAWRAVTGMGSAAGNIGTMGLLSSWFTARRRGLATGIAVSGSSIALILTGELLPGLLAARPADGWRVSWYLLGAGSLLIAALAAALLRDGPRQGVTGRTPAGPAAEQAGPIASAPEPAAAGLRWGLVYRARPVWHLGGVYAAFGFSYIVYLTFFVRYLSGELGYTDQAAGRLFMLIGWLSLACGFLWGALSDRIGRSRTLTIIFAVQAVSFTLFGIVPLLPIPGTGPAGAAVTAVVLASVCLFGITTWSIPAVMAAACGDVVGRRLAPAALGFVTLFFGIGQALGPLAAGAAADAAASFTWSFIMAAGVAAAGGAGSLLLKPGSSPETGRPPAREKAPGTGNGS
jgi:MFS family permease